MYVQTEDFTGLLMSCNPVCILPSCHRAQEAGYTLDTVMETDTQTVLKMSNSADNLFNNAFYLTLTL